MLPGLPFQVPRDRPTGGTACLLWPRDVKAFSSSFSFSFRPLFVAVFLFVCCCGRGGRIGCSCWATLVPGGSLAAYMRCMCIPVTLYTCLHAINRAPASGGTSRAPFPGDISPSAGFYEYRCGRPGVKMHHKYVRQDAMYLVVRIMFAMLSWGDAVRKQ